MLHALRLVQQFCRDCGEAGHALEPLPAAMRVVTPDADARRRTSYRKFHPNGILGTLQGDWPR